MSEFFVGQKVVRIKTAPMSYPAHVRTDIGDLLEIGQIYEVRWTGIYGFMQPDGSMQDMPAIRLVGITRCTQSPTKKSDIIMDVPWGSRLFRPLQETGIRAAASKSIELFRKIARDVTEGKKVRIRT